MLASQIVFFVDRDYSALSPTSTGVAARHDLPLKMVGSTPLGGGNPAPIAGRMSFRDFSTP
jgi:hypothetical protein